MRNLLLVRVLLIIVAVIVIAEPASPQSSREAPSGSVINCPPDLQGEPHPKPFSDLLAQSRGVSCPPPVGLDQDMGFTPPSGDRPKIVPPPGSDYDQSVEPK
jgi:hypothetical protein